jgi:hypothetical protein
LKPQRRGREPWKTDESALSELAGLWSYPALVDT